MTYSKKLPIVTGAIFIFTLIFCLLSGGDYTVRMTAITTTASAFTGTIIWYLKKAQVENTYKLDMSSYKEKAKVELDHLENLIRIKKEYEINDTEIDEMYFKSDLDDMTREAFQKIRTNVDTAQADARPNSGDFAQ